MRPFRSALITCCALLSPATIATAQQPATITIDTGKVLGPVNRLIFGHNLEAADNARIFASDTTSMDGIQTGGGFWDPHRAAPVPEVVNACKAVGMGMMRYPGGCLAHNFDWRKAVGPEAKKNGWLFGVDEYLALCRSIGAEPIFTISDYVLPADQMPENAAGLVEYLNAPATPEHPWAMKRKAWGHAEPYHVTWFELGNESVHGNHRVIPHRQYTPEEYAAYANETAAAMRRVDPSIRIGIVMVPSAGTDVENNWNRTVAHLAGKSADFVVVHLYAPHAGVKAAPEEVLMQSTMAVGEQSEHHLDEFRSMSLRESGRDLPLAVTEYNGSLGETIKPYRFSYGEALESADLIRVFLLPEHRVLTANYWQFLNGYFGMLRRSPKGETEMPAFPLYRMWGQHFGSQLVSTSVIGPRLAFLGAGSVQPADGDTFRERRILGDVALTTTHAAESTSKAKGSFIYTWKDARGDAYPKLGYFEALSAKGGGSLEYDLSFEARFVTDAKGELPAIGLGIGDSRGWSATHSGLGIDGVRREWRPFHGTYTALADTRGIDFTARLQKADVPLSGTLEVRNLSIKSAEPTHYPAYNLLTSSASLSADGKTLYVIVFNKSAAESIQAKLRFDGFAAKKAHLWQVNGPGLATFDGVREVKHGDELPVASGEATYAFPAHSMTALELTR